MRKSFWIAAMIFAAMGVPAAHASGVDAIYAFGDSLSDTGNIFILTGGALPLPPYVGGQFTNGNVWLQDFASDIGMGPVAPSLAGGTDYAYGGAETAVTSFNTAPAQTDLLGPTGQLAQFSATHPTADPNALYTIWIGSNDLIGILGSSPTPSQAATDLGLVAGNVDTAINALAGAGAKNFLILTVPDLGKIPEALGEGPVAAAAASALAATFDTTLVGGGGAIPSLATLAALDSVDISVLNTYSLLDSLASNPMYGFTNVTIPCYTGTDYGFSDTGDPGTVCATPNQYLFWDELHPTAAADVYIAAAAATVTPTPEPSSFLLPGTGLLGLFGLAARRKAA
jgi:phospholipase/lecithinase/hemolysin